MVTPYWFLLVTIGNTTNLIIDPPFCYPLLALQTRSTIDVACVMETNAQSPTNSENKKEQIQPTATNNKSCIKIHQGLNQHA